MLAEFAYVTNRVGDVNADSRIASAVFDEVRMEKFNVSTNRDQGGLSHTEKGAR